MSVDKKALRLYLIITFALSLVIETVWIVYGNQAAGISALLMFMPFVSAMVVSIKFYKKQNILGFSSSKFIYNGLSFLIPLFYIALSNGLFWLFVKGSYTGNLSILIEYARLYSGKELPENMAVIISLIIMLPSSFVTAFGEEIGWRGYMYPAMQKLWGWKKALIVSGAVWALWHLPLVISGVYLPGASILFAVPVFIIEVFALTVIISWVRIKSNSVWPAVILHATHNYFDQAVFQSLTKSENSAYFVGETGVITVVITVLIATVILVKKRGTFINNADLL